VTKEDLRFHLIFARPFSIYILADALMKRDSDYCAITESKMAACIMTSYVLCSSTNFQLISF